MVGIGQLVVYLYRFGKSPSGDKSPRALLLSHEEVARRGFVFSHESIKGPYLMLDKVVRPADGPLYPAR